MIYSLILPSITVSFGQIPPLVRSLREQLIETLDADFVLTLCAAKLPKRVILWKHVLHNAVVPTLMLLSVNLSYLIGGTPYNTPPTRHASKYSLLTISLIPAP